MRKKLTTILFSFLTFLNVAGQNQLFKGKNLLIPSNLVVNYTVRLDSCYRLINGQCTDTISKAFLSNNPERNILEIVIDSALAGNVNCYKTDTWLTYQLMENRNKISVPEIEKRMNISPIHLFNMKEIIGLNFIEEWEVTDNPVTFKKNVIAYMPIRRFYMDDDIEFENPLYNVPFTIIDTLEKKSQIKKSSKRMVLTNEIAYEYFFFLDYNLPYDIDLLTKTFKKTKQSTDNYILSKETSEYLTEIGVLNFLKTVVGQVITGELHAYDFSTDSLLSTKEVMSLMGYKETTNEKFGVSDSSYTKVFYPMDFEEIQSLIFLEKWYIDPVSLRMQKKVVGIAPVRHYYKDDDEYEVNLNRKILFKIYFEDR